MSVRASGRLAAALLVLAPAIAGAQSNESFDVHGQATYVWQQKRPFEAPYSGAHSLSPASARSYSFPATPALGTRPWDNAQIWLDPEIAAGVPLSGLTGLGGFTNGEIARTSGPNPKLYRARLCLRQPWGYGGASQDIEPEMNRFGGEIDR